MMSVCKTVNGNMSCGLPRNTDKKAAVLKITFAVTVASVHSF